MMDLVERCAECGFDGAALTDAQAVAAIGDLPDRWLSAVDGIGVADLLRRPIADMWSIGEYADHVREVLFGMRFVLDIAITSLGNDLGDPPEPEFTPEARVVDVPAALDAIRSEADRLRARLEALDPDEWSRSARFDGADHDVHWIARHAVHDASHHLMDVARLRLAMPI